MKKLMLVLLGISLLAVPLGGCGGELTLTMYDPEDGATINWDATLYPFYVIGTVSDPDATVTVNGVEVEVGSRPPLRTGTVFVEMPTAFWIALELTEGENTITIVATKGEETVTETLTVIYAPEQEKKSPFRHA